MLSSENLRNGDENGQLYVWQIYQLPYDDRGRADYDGVAQLLVGRVFFLIHLMRCV